MRYDILYQNLMSIMAIKSIIGKNNVKNNNCLISQGLKFADPAEYNIKNPIKLNANIRAIILKFSKASLLLKGVSI